MYPIFYLLQDSGIPPFRASWSLVDLISEHGRIRSWVSSIVQQSSSDLHFSVYPHPRRRILFEGGVGLGLSGIAGALAQEPYQCLANERSPAAELLRVAGMAFCFGFGSAGSRPLDSRLQLHHVRGPCGDRSMSGAKS